MSNRNEISASNRLGSSRPALLDWMETHSRIMGFWLDRLIDDGDEGDVVTMLHQQQSWLNMMQDRLRRDGS